LSRIRLTNAPLPAVNFQYIDRHGRSTEAVRKVSLDIMSADAIAIATSNRGEVAPRLRRGGALLMRSELSS